MTIEVANDDMGLGGLIDQLYALRADRLDLTKRVDAMKSEEASLRSRILEELDDIGLAKASGAMATCGVTMSIQPMVEDWDKVHEWIREHNRFDMLQKRLSIVAWRDLVQDSGELVPGTLVTEVRDVSLTKSTRG